MTTSHDVLHLAGTARRGSFVLDVDLRAEAGDVVAVLGPNGSGKSTMLDVIAGFIGLSHGHLDIGGHRLDDGHHAAPPGARRVGLMTAAGDLFPHLSAVDNVAFGLRARGVARSHARSRATEELAQVGLGGFETRRPHELSTGQAQRVALARALATDPTVLLLDEPLSAIDRQGRHELRTMLADRLGRLDAATVLVTHDPMEALTLADRVVVLDAGRIDQEGSPEQVVRRPRSPFVARLAGLNLWRGRVLDGALTTSEGHRIVTADPHQHRADDDADSAPRTQDFAVFAPTAVSLWPTRPHGSPRNTWRVRVRGIEQTGASVRVDCCGEADLVADITLESVAGLGLHVGQELYATVKATDVALYR